MTKIYSTIRDAYWGFCLAAYRSISVITWAVTGDSKHGKFVRIVPLPEPSEKFFIELEHAANTAIATTDGVDIGAISVWTENEKPCSGHCYHEVKTPQRHRFNLGLDHKDVHKDFVCCRCTHGRCVTIRDGYAKHALALSGLTSGSPR